MSQQLREREREREREKGVINETTVVLELQHTFSKQQGIVFSRNLTQFSSASATPAPETNQTS